MTSTESDAGASPSEPRLKEHELKCWPEFFFAHITGHKNFEIRPTRDRDFKVGDILVLREFVPCPVCGGTGLLRDYTELVHCGCHWTEHCKGTYTGRTLKRLVTYITDFGQKPDMIVMALAEWRDAPASPRQCPSPGRVAALAEHMESLGGYTQAQEILAMGAELVRLRVMVELATHGTEGTLPPGGSGVGVRRGPGPNLDTYKR